MKPNTGLKWVNILILAPNANPSTNPIIYLKKPCESFDNGNKNHHQKVSMKTILSSCLRWEIFQLQVILTY